MLKIRDRLFDERRVYELAHLQAVTIWDAEEKRAVAFPDDEIAASRVRAAYEELNKIGSKLYELEVKVQTFATAMNMYQTAGWSEGRRYNETKYFLTRVAHDGDITETEALQMMHDILEIAHAYDTEEDQ